MVTFSDPSRYYYPVFESQAIELESLLLQLKNVTFNSGDKITEITLVGHSNGGNVCRYLVSNKMSAYTHLKNIGIMIKSMITMGTPFLGSGLGALDIPIYEDLIYDLLKKWVPFKPPEIDTQKPYFPKIWNNYYNYKLLELNKSTLNSDITFHSIIVSEQGAQGDLFNGISLGDLTNLMLLYKGIYNESVTINGFSKYGWQWLTSGTDNVVNVLSQNLLNVFILYNHPFPRPNHRFYVVYLTNQEVKNSFWEYGWPERFNIAHLAEPKNDNIADVVISILKSKLTPPGTNLSPEPPDVTPPAITIPPSPIASDNMMFLNETYPDNSYIEPGVSFTKTWTVKNTGTSTWSGYSFVRIKSTGLSSQDTIPVPTVLPGNQVTLSVPMHGPATPGVYQEYWKLKNSSGKYFGYAVWALIVVDPNTALPITQIPLDTRTMMAGGPEFTFELRIKNTSNLPWTNNDQGEGVNFPGFAELRSVDAGGNEVNSMLYIDGRPEQWVNRQRIYSLVEDEVAPDTVGTFRFQGQIAAGTTPGQYKCYFRPHIGHRGLVKNWAGAYFTINVVSSGTYPPPTHTPYPPLPNPPVTTELVQK